MLHTIAVRTPEEIAVDAQPLEQYLERADIFTPSHKCTDPGDVFDREMAYAQLRISPKPFKELLRTGEFMLAPPISSYFQRVYELAQEHPRAKIHYAGVPSTKEAVERRNSFIESSNSLDHAIEAFLDDELTQAKELISTALRLIMREQEIVTRVYCRSIDALCAEHAPSEKLVTWVIALSDRHQPKMLADLKKAAELYSPRVAFECFDMYHFPYTLFEYALRKHQPSAHDPSPQNPRSIELSDRLATDIILEHLFAPLNPTYQNLFSHAHTLATLPSGEKDVLIRLARDNSDVLVSPRRASAANTLAETCGIRRRDPALVFTHHYPFDWDLRYSSEQGFDDILL